VAVDSTTIQLEGTYTVTYTGKSLLEVAEEISTSSQEYEAVALNDVTYLSSGDLVKVGTTTHFDGGYIVWLEGHVVKYTEETRVRLLPPYSNDPRAPWFGRIDTGEFVKDYKGVRYVFSVPEYDKQEWSIYHGKPFVDQVGIQARKLDGKTLRVPRTPLYWRGNITISINGVVQATSVIRDVDEFNGLIFLAREVEERDLVKVSYVYREKTFVYRDINLNPTINHMPQFVGQFILYYLKPAYDSLGRIWSQTVYHSVAPTLEGAISQIPIDDVPIVLLGALLVRQVSTIDEVVLTDTRSRGGGVKEDLYDEAVKVNRHMLAATDRGTWDVVPYPGNAVVVIDIPASLKDAVSVNEIRDRVRRHIAFGVEPVLEFREGE
jgi:hypothetical protein